MSNEMLLLLVVLIVVIGVLPTWPYSQSWGYGPTGLLAVVLIVMIIWAMSGGRIPGNSPSTDLQADVKEVGQDLKEMGRDAADSIRRTVQ